ncbi:hypothetical protein SWK1_025 [Streptococcus phage SWK1]|nr:hypothetical protein SWK1_025 [Streptococcus phage SWK1]
MLETVFEDELASFLLLEEVLAFFFFDEEVCSVLAVSTDDSDLSVGEIKAPMKNIIMARSPPISDFLRRSLFFFDN